MQFINAAIATAILAFASAAPTQIQERAAFFYPADTVSTFSSIDGLNFNTGTVQIFTDSTTLDQVSTLVTFSLPAESFGKQCTLHFIPQSVSGSGQFDIFSSLAPASPTSTNNQRNSFLIREQAFVDSSPIPVDTASDQFPCPSATTFGIELAPVADANGNDYIVDDVTSGAVGSVISISYI